MNARFYPFPRILSVVALAASLLTGCAETDPTLFGAAISAESFDEKLEELGDARLEVELRADGTTAREIEIYPPSFLGDEEYIESLVTSLDPDGGTLTLALGGLSITIAAEARFRTPEESNAAPSEFYEMVASRLAAGEPVFVRVVRPAPATPQSPDDPSFVASELRLEDEVDAAKLEINVAGANVVASGDAGTLTVLGVAIAITSQTAIYEGSEHGPDHS